MASRTNRCNYGLNAGDTVNVGDTGNNGNSAFNIKLVGTGTISTIVADATSWGDPAVRMTQNSGATTNSVGFGWNGFSATNIGGVMEFEFPPGGMPTSSSVAINIESATNVSLGKLYLTATGKVSVFNAAGTNIGTSTTVLPSTGRIKVALVAIAGTTTSNGTLKGALWTSNFAGVPTEELLFVGNANAGTAAATAIYFGKPQNSTWAENFRVTNFKMDDAAEGNYPLVSTNIAPVSNAGATKTVAVGSSVTLNGTDSDSDGTVASRQWTLLDSVPANAAAPAIQNANTANLIVTPSAPGKFRYKYNAIDNVGATSVDSITTLFATSTNAKAAAVTGVTEFTTFGGSDLVTSVSDAVSTTGVSYPAGSTAVKTIKYRLTPLPSLTTLSIPVSRKLTQAGTGNLVIKLYQGSTVKFTWTDVVSSTTLSTYTLTHLNGTGDIASISDWNELDLEFSWGS